MKIGTIDLGHRPVTLAPMEDVTDASFRILCREAGAAMVTTQFVSSGKLDGLFAILQRRPAGRDNLEAFGFAFVPPGEDGGLFPLCHKHTQNHFHVGRFPRSAGGYVAYANGRDRGRETLLPAFVVQEMPYS